MAAMPPETVGWLPDHLMMAAAPGTATPAHDQAQAHKYIMHYPQHLPRADDPYYKIFNTYHNATRSTAKCFIGSRVGFDTCAGGLELHHAHVEFSLVNAIYLPAIQIDHPDLTNADAVAKWVESDANFRWLCMFHHRGHAGAHTSAHADWEAGQYIPALIS